MSRLKRWITAAIILVVFLVAALLAVTHYQVHQKTHLTEPRLLILTSGTSFHQFVKQLVSQNIIDSRVWLRNYVRIYRDLADIKAGTYQITPEQTLKDILSMVVTGKEYQFTITFIEGSTLKQWFKQLRENTHIKQTIKPNSNQYQLLAQRLNIEGSNPEGLFYPDTYAFTENTSDIELLTRAYQRMQQELNDAWQSRASGLPYDEPYQALIMASIIEKESGLHAEHELIASVFVNRLNEGMRLQTDPTVIYGLGDSYQGDIKRQHLKQRTPYNTYRINGLPPTPIAMPGKSAIRAALNPAPSDYLYFVSDGTGKHIFSTNLADHNKAVVQYQLN